MSSDEATLTSAAQPSERGGATVADLVFGQFDPQACDLLAEPPSPLPLLRLTQEGIVQSWNWRMAFAACGLKGERDADSWFIQYVGAGLCEMGIPDLACHLRVLTKRDHQAQCQIDIAAQHQGKLWLLDLKLRRDSSERPDDHATLTAQLHRVLELRQRLAALTPQMVLVRPCRLFTESERGLARVCGLEVIDQREAPRLFSRLAAMLKLPGLSPELMELESLLIDQVARRGRLLVFGEGEDRLRQQEADSGGPEVVDLEAHLRRVAQERGQNWVLWATRTEIGLRLERIPNAPTELPSLIHTALSHFGKVRVESFEQGYEAIFTREEARLAKLRQALAGFVNRRLETLVFVQVRPQRPTSPPGGARLAGRPTPPTPPPIAPPQSFGALEDLEAAVDRACKNKPQAKAG